MLQGGQAITAAWLDKRLQETEDTNAALLEPELMLVKRCHPTQ